jgi:integrase
MDTSNFTTRYFKPLVKKAGISENFTFHSLRHNHASILLKNGVNPKVIQERLGHSTISMTLDLYAHIMPDMQQEAVSAIEKMKKQQFV